ncbi:ROK family protein [Streptomyces sp. NPDC058525]|uniref:ROK family protein n=1 Tax=Streptomyces sp. NPDC058525 TaxID=3346538 RepID=UPI00365C7229
MKHVVALDVGGTGRKAALLAQDGLVLFEARRPTERQSGTDAVVAAILDFVAPLAAGVAVPGTFDVENGLAVFSANFGWRDLPIRKLLGERLEASRWRSATTSAQVGGRGQVGCGCGVDRFLFIALGTGIAGAIGIDGRIEAGTHGYGGEIGHAIVR